MKHIMEQYGRFLMTGAIFVALLATIFFGVQDDAGHRGFLQIMGSKAETGGTDYSSYQDFSHLSAESGKEKPVIETVLDQTVYKNEEYSLDDLIQAKAYDGTNLELVVDYIDDKEGNRVTGIYSLASKKIIFPEEGIYKIKVWAADDGNRTSNAVVQIPVNRR